MAAKRVICDALLAHYSTVTLPSSADQHGQLPPDLGVAEALGELKAASALLASAIRLSLLRPSSLPAPTVPTGPVDDHGAPPSLVRPTGVGHRTFLTSTFVSACFEALHAALASRPPDPPAAAQDSPNDDSVSTDSTEGSTGDVSTSVGFASSTTWSMETARRMFEARLRQALLATGISWCLPWDAGAIFDAITSCPLGSANAAQSVLDATRIVTKAVVIATTTSSTGSASTAPATPATGPVASVPASHQQLGACCV